MKILFLDIDGVLNCQSSWSREENKDKGTYVIDDEKTQRLVSLIKELDLKIVLSSTWRNHQDHVDFLYEKGVLHSDWVHKDWKTGRSWRAYRGEEVRDWVLDHPEIDQYAIIDDNSDFYKEQKKYFVQTSWSSHQGGLQDKHIKRLKEIYTK